MDDGIIYHTRTFKKLFMILAEYFPIFRLLLFFLKKFTQHIKMSLIKRKLIELVFENERIIVKRLSKTNLINYNIHLNGQINKSENELIIKDKSLNNNKFNKLNYINNNITIIKNNNNFINNINKNYEDNKNNNNININNINQINDNNSVKNNDIISSNNILKKNDTISYNNALNGKFLEEEPVKKINKTNCSLITPNNNKIIFVEPIRIIKKPKKNILAYNRQKKYLFSYYYYFFDIIFDNLIGPKKFLNFDKRYFIIYNFMSKIYDISSHIFLVKQCNLLNNYVKEKINEEKDIYLDKLCSKININDNQVLEKISNEIKSRKSILFSKGLW